jgi:hypothetical protein
MVAPELDHPDQLASAEPVLGICAVSLLLHVDPGSGQRGCWSVTPSPERATNA